MENLQISESDELIAPQEMRELLTRLTESQVEVGSADEPRTLAGLASGTGIPLSRLQKTLNEIRKRPTFATMPLLVACIGTVMMVGILYVTSRSFPHPQGRALASVPRAAASITIGLVGLDRVTYGPDMGTMMVDPSFKPSIALPKGVSLSASVDDVLWGTGNHHAGILQHPFDEKQLKDLRACMRELLEYARKRASERSLAFSPTITESPAEPLEAYALTVLMQTDNASTSFVVRVPRAGRRFDDEASLAIKQGGEDAINQLQGSLISREETRRQFGP